MEHEPSGVTVYICFARMKASPLLAAYGSAICRSGRVLDYIVASNCIIPAISDVPFSPAPWETHDFITFKLLRTPRSLEAKYLIRPSRFVSSGFCDWQDQLSHFAPVECDSDLGKPPVDFSSSVFFRMNQACLQTGMRYAAWSRAAECALSGSTGHIGLAFRGRGVFQDSLAGPFPSQLAELTGLRSS